MPPVSPDVRAAADFIRARIEHLPSLGLILGSGLSELADLVADPVTIESNYIPGYPSSTVEGHPGRLVFGRLEGQDVAFLQGRLHMYEGYSASQVTFPVRLLVALGIERLIITNAAGGIRKEFGPGTLMFIRDHINWTFQDPTTGSDALFQRGSASPFDPDWLCRAQAIATDIGIPTREGVYIWVAGPSYETKAEIRAFSALGADAVGMSTVPEALEASRLGISALGLSTITNPAAGLAAQPLVHGDVLKTGRQVRMNLEKLLLALVYDLRV